MSTDKQSIEWQSFLKDLPAIPCSNCGEPRTIEDICFKPRAIGMSTAEFLCRKCKTKPKSKDDE